MKLSNFLLALLILLIMLLVVGVEQVDGFDATQFYACAADRTAVVVEFHKPGEETSEIVDVVWLERAREKERGFSYQTAIIYDPMREVFNHRQNRSRYSNYARNQRTGEYAMRPMPRELRSWLS